MLHGARVGVTGATGFLGSHVARGLLARGAQVVGIVRSPERGAALAAEGIALRQADLGDPASLARAFTGLDALVANAARASETCGDDPEGFAAADEEGTRSLVDAALSVGVPRVIHVSSVAVYDIPWPCQRIGEDQPLRARGVRRDVTWLVTRRGYADAKARSERVVWEAMARGLRPTVLRPGPVYGSGDEKMTRRYRDLVARGLRVVPTVGVPHVHAGDVAQAVAGALADDATVGRAYNVTGEPVSLLEVLRGVRDHTAGRSWLVPVPVPLWLAWDNARAIAELGVRYRPLGEGLREAFRR